MLIISSGKKPFKADFSKFHPNPAKTPYLKISEDKFTVTIQKYPALLSELIEIRINCFSSKENRIRCIQNNCIVTHKTRRMSLNTKLSPISKSEFKDITEKISKLYQSKEAGVFFKETATAFVNGSMLDPSFKTFQILPQLIIDGRKNANFPFPFTMKLITKIREYFTTKERNEIIQRLFNYYYIQFIHPKSVLETHLREADCASLVKLVKREGSSDPSLSATAMVRRGAIPLSLWNGLL